LKREKLKNRSRKSGLFAERQEKEKHTQKRIDPRHSGDQKNLRKANAFSAGRGGRSDTYRRSEKIKPTRVQV